MAKPRFFDLTINAVREDTSSSVEISFKIPEALKSTFVFVPGQYLTLRADVGGEDVRRSYSICSPVGSDTLSVGVKRIEGGAFSGFALSLKPGDVLRVMPPQGRFTAPIGGRHDYLLLAAGSGVTPIKSIAQSVLEGEPESTITLCYANCNTDSVMFRQAFDDLKDKYLTRFLMTHVMDEEAQDVALFNGRMDAEKLNTMATRGLITPLEYDAIYICGPQPMIETASEALRILGVPADRIKFELFTPSSPLPIAGAASVEAATEGALVEVVLDGARRKFRMLAGQMLLDAATQSGLELPYSCANGMCATCRCKLAEGQGTMVQNFSLEAWEMKKGFVLACQFRPQSDRVVLDFDAV
ncbi:1,2-phenylacetyl-CoA epoxidase, subunit E [marine metagenome]|nr:2Fe-2S iron-sulfur cluster-binding protein [Planktomarina sp.]